MIELSLNVSFHEVDVDEDMPLPRVLRDELGLVGTKYGCGKGLCGACGVLIDGNVVRSCAISAGRVTGEVIAIALSGNLCLRGTCSPVCSAAVLGGLAIGRQTAYQ